MKKIFLLLFVLLAGVCSYAHSLQKDTTSTNNEVQKYRRSSLYSVLYKYPAIPYAKEIDSAFMATPMPDKYNNHNLPWRVIESTCAKEDMNNLKVRATTQWQDVINFLRKHNVPKAIVSKWFNRDTTDGSFNMDLVQERGLYDASQLDIAKAKSETRRLATLGDAGEKLIGNTFLIVNDITYVDKGEVSANVASVISALGSLMAAATNESSYQSLGNTVAGLTNEIDGFSLQVISYLFKLEWTPTIAENFYGKFWINKGENAPDKKLEYDKDTSFLLRYIGVTRVSAGNLSTKSFSSKSKSMQMLTTCARAVDKSIAQLQKNYPVFRVNVPIYEILDNNKFVTVKIGLKEGISPKSIYEILLPEEDANGNIQYVSVGKIKPVANMIWDNRFGALEEAEQVEKAKANGESVSKDASEMDKVKLNATTFKVLSGGHKLVPGCLVREVK